MFAFLKNIRSWLSCDLWSIFQQVLDVFFNYVVIKLETNGKIQQVSCNASQNDSLCNSQWDPGGVQVRQLTSNWKAQWTSIWTSALTSMDYFGWAVSYNGIKLKSQVEVMRAMLSGHLSFYKASAGKSLQMQIWHAAYYSASIRTAQLVCVCFCVCPSSFCLVTLWGLF